MIVAITKRPGEHEVLELKELLGNRGIVENVVVRGDGCSVLSVTGGESLVQTLESSPLVSRVMTITGPWGMVAKEHASDVAPMNAVPGCSFGGTQFSVLAGPCSVEGHQQLLSVAQSVKESGAVGLRGGAFKPRTSPYAFQGLGHQGLEHLAAVRQQTGLSVVTEVMSAGEVERVAAAADMLQIGSRNVQNYRLLEAVGRCDTPVLLKRGMMSTIDEFLGSAEYIYARGNENIVLCERGIRSFEPRLRNTLDLGAVALLKRLTHLPVIVDPSHGTGLSELVAPLAKAALAMGADGLMLEVHSRPEIAKSDGRQSLSVSEFATLMTELAPLAQVLGRTLGSPMTAGHSVSGG